MIRVLHSVSNMDRGGIETMLMNYYRHIDRSKVQFDFIVNKKKPATTMTRSAVWAGISTKARDLTRCTTRRICALCSRPWPQIPASASCTPTTRPWSCTP